MSKQEDPVGDLLAAILAGFLFGTWVLVWVCYGLEIAR